MKRWIYPLFLIPIIFWLLSLPTEGLGGTGFWAIRRESIFLSGILAYTMMAIAMLLAMRPVWLERYLGGLDHGYKLHKWLGISAGLLIFTHWMCEIVPKAISKAGWLSRPVKGAKTSEPFLGFLIDPAKDVGEWLAYGMLAIIILSLIKFFPYHWFRRLHKIFPVAFLVATFHSIVLMPDALWPTATGVLVGICAIIGSFASVYILLGYVGKNRTWRGSVQAITRHADGVLEISCRLEQAGFKYEPGQFAFVRFDGTKDPHPFSIASASPDSQNIRFCVKVLGDDTRKLFDGLQVGSLLQLEGPYGKFDFKSSKKAQVWVGGGVGAAPFISQLEHLAANPASSAMSKPNITFFYCAPENSDMNKIVSELSQRAQVRLHLIDKKRDGALNLEKISQDAGGLNDASLWFCGPSGLGDNLYQAWTKMGLRGKSFRREFFVMR